ncbi:MAG: hypothetical protein DI588_07345 [Flavobacterium johnsoniae]|nr:MAG: hypothetical protein DI588_07345 [Flavobacterium johnsoniae]
MDRSEPLTSFFAAIQDDGRISMTHIAVYAALLQFRIEKGFSNPIQAYSHEIMKLAKISAPITYHRCIRELSEYGYIKYLPSFKRTQASEIRFKELTRTGSMASL